MANATMKKKQRSVRRQRRLGTDRKEDSSSPRTVREKYKPLIDWVRFANGQEQFVPGVPLMIARDPAEMRKSVREIVVNIALLVALPPKDILAGTSLRRGPAQNWGRLLIRALAGRIDRLRICPMCQNAFVALDKRAETCSNNCRQQKFYRLHPQEQRERKKEEYASSRRLRRKTGRPGLWGRERAERLALADALRSLD